MYKKIILSMAGILLLIICSAWKYRLQDVIGIDINGDNTHYKTVYLTFDDGPSKCTEEVLNILEENNACATFFLIGNQINEETAPVLDRMVKDGNQIGIHTFSHEAAEIYESAESYYSDVMKAEEAINKYTGIKPDVFRFPWGSNNCYIRGFRRDIVDRLKAVGLEYCDWNVSGEDSVGHPYASRIIENVRSNYDVYDNPVLLLHDSATSTETVKALETIIKMYKEAGYQFATLSEREETYKWKI